MKIGMVGLGKLGMPVAAAIGHHGHEVIGYDVRPEAMQKESFPHMEVGYGSLSIEQTIQTSNLRFGSLREVVEESEIIFVAVQTPHEEQYEGHIRLPETRADFDYTYMRNVICDISIILDQLKERRIVVVISTVLPGTMRREVYPIMSEYLDLVYNPFFIAMGTTIDDFLNPEFVLVGVMDDAGGLYASRKLMEFYGTLHSKPIYQTSVESAEAIKVFYNTYISMKICFVNTIMEVADQIPNMDVDEVTNAFALATDRLISTKYMRGGMGDGGGCHPRDNIALSWLAQEMDLSYDWFGNVMLCRENQTEYLADVIEDYLPEDKRWVGLYGKAFKAGTNLLDGSPALLLKQVLEERNIQVSMWDPYVDDCDDPWVDIELEDRPDVYFISTNHPDFQYHAFPAGHPIIDPWRYIEWYQAVYIGSYYRGD